MKTQEVASFENDVAAEWLANLMSNKEISKLYEAFELVIGENASYRPGLQECCTALTAAEILSHLVGCPRIPPVVKSGEIGHLASFLTYDRCRLRMIRLAIISIERILAEICNPEICQVWGIEGSLRLSCAAAANDLLFRLEMAEKSINTDSERG